MVYVWPHRAGERDAARFGHIAAFWRLNVYRGRGANKVRSTIDVAVMVYYHQIGLWPSLHPCLERTPIVRPDKALLSFPFLSHSYKLFLPTLFSTRFNNKRERKKEI